MKFSRDFFLDKKREKAKLEAEMKFQVTLKQLIPAGEAIPSGPLGVILSQYYLNLTEFCTKFNKLSAEWEDGVLLPIKVKKGLRAKDYKLIMQSPTISYLLDNARDDQTGDIYYLELWDIICLKSVLLDLPEDEVACLVFSFLGASSIYRIRFKK